MFTRYANAARFEALASRLSPIAFAVFVVAALIGLGAGLAFSPPDYQQGETVRIMYVHVPAAWLALQAYVLIAVLSLMAFVWSHSVADVIARAAAAPGAAFTALALATGAIWGKPTWGAWWVWDGRLTSMLVLLFIYLGYIAVWEAASDRARAAKFARIIAMVGVINIPIIKFSVDWWATLHQPASILRMDGPTIHGSMLVPLFAMLIAYTALFAWCVLTGARAELLERRGAAVAARAPRRPAGPASTAPERPRA